MAGWLAYVCVVDRYLSAVNLGAVTLALVALQEIVTAYRMTRPNNNKDNRIGE